MDRSEPWGDYWLTPVGPEGQEPKHYQIRCGFPDHNTEHACTKKRAVSFGGKDEVLLCLKCWASLGSLYETAEDHPKLFEEVVVPAWRNKTIPPESSLVRTVSQDRCDRTCRVRYCLPHCVKRECSKFTGSMRKLLGEAFISEGSNMTFETYKCDNQHSYASTV